MRDVNRYAPDKDRARNTAVLQLNFINANKKYLRRLRNGEKLIKAAEDFTEKIRLKEALTPNQMYFIESIYEKVMKGAGYPSADTKHDFGKKKERGE